jgi:hypothetical protein
MLCFFWQLFGLVADGSGLLRWYRRKLSHPTMLTDNPGAFIQRSKNVLIIKLMGICPGVNIKIVLSILFCS